MGEVKESDQLQWVYLAHPWLNTHNGITNAMPMSLRELMRLDTTVMNTNIMFLMITVYTVA